MSAGRGADTVGLDVTIMGREYRVTCKPDEQRELLDAVAFVDTQMREFRDSLRQNNAERVAVMTALNLANELLRARSAASAVSRGNGDPARTRDDVARDDGDVGHAPAQRSSESDVDLTGLRRRIQLMQSTIDTALAAQDRLL